jgi:hypothetical protein
VEGFLVRSTTSCASAASLGIKALPMNPLPPVTMIFIVPPREVCVQFAFSEVLFYLLDHRRQVRANDTSRIFNLLGAAL